jgi:L-threonylcarbamoyladenylate synthase
MISKDLLAQAKSAIEQEKLIVFPTDTLVAIATSATQTGLTSLFTTKQRPADKQVGIMAAHFEDIKPYLEDLSAPEKQIVKDCLPGPVTLILRTKPDFPFATTPNGNYSPTIALRIPSNQTAQQILEATGPIATTSANISDEEPAKTVAEAMQSFSSLVSVYVDDNEPAQQATSSASPILKVVNGEIKVLRGVWKSCPSATLLHPSVATSDL